MRQGIIIGVLVVLLYFLWPYVCLLHKFLTVTNVVGWYLVDITIYLERIVNVKDYLTTQDFTGYLPTLKIPNFTDYIPALNFTGYLPTLNFTGYLPRLNFTDYFPTLNTSAYREIVSGVPKMATFISTMLNIAAVQ